MWRKYLTKSQLQLGTVIGLAICLIIGPLQANAATPYPGYTFKWPYWRYCNTGRPIRSVRTAQKYVAFTFDDGPDETDTRRIMTYFEKYGWRASFFVIGDRVNYLPTIAKEITTRGHIIANHTMHHTYTVSSIISGIRPANDAIYYKTGIRTTYFRSPGLTRSSSIDYAVFNTNFSCNISTDYDLGDWRSPRASAWTLCERFKQSLHNGSIVLLHDGGTHQQTADAVPCMLAYVKARGYTAVPLATLLREGVLNNYSFVY